MKKVLSLSVAIVLALLCFTGTFAISQTQPYASGTMGTECFRIPAIYTLNDGTVMTAADMRNTTGVDSPGNLDTLLSFWNGSELSYVKVNTFEDVPDGVNETNSASYIDSAIVQSKSSGRIFIITSTFPTGYGSPNAEKGTGMTDDGKHIILTNKGNTSKKSDYSFYIGDFDGEYAPIIGADGYTVDKNHFIYKNGEPLYTTQKGTGVQIQQSIFYSNSAFHVYPTSFLTLKYSDDNGKIWSSPILLNYLKNESEKFFGAGPGRGTLTINSEGNERILFCVYDNGTSTEKTSVIYSDDNGLTWQRSERVNPSLAIGKTSEAQIINCPDGSLLMFTRNNSRYVGTSRSYDAGETWSTAIADTDLDCTKNCMVSFINTNKVIEGKQVVLGSYACGGNDRKNGVIRTGLMDEKGNISWIRSYHINEGFFAYSCLTQLKDGKIACLYEDGPYQITLGIFEIGNDGTISSADSDNIDFEENVNFFKKVAIFFRELFQKIFSIFSISF